MISDVLIAIGHHRAATIPLPSADDVDFARKERVSGPYDAADVEVVLPILDRNVEVVPALVEIGDDRTVPPITVPIDNVTVIAAGQEIGVEPLVIWPRERVWTDAWSKEI